MCSFYRRDLNKNHNEQNRSLRVFSSLKSLFWLRAWRFFSFSLLHWPLLDFYTQNKGPAFWKLCIVIVTGTGSHKLDSTFKKPHNTALSIFFPYRVIFWIEHVCACDREAGTGENLLHHRFSNWNDDWFGIFFFPLEKATY